MLHAFYNNKNIKAKKHEHATYAALFFYRLTEFCYATGHVTDMSNTPVRGAPYFEEKFAHPQKVRVGRVILTSTISNGYDINTNGPK